MTSKLPSDSEALDQLAAVMSANKWNADLMDPVFRIITATGRTIDDPNNTYTNTDTDTQTERTEAQIIADGPPYTISGSEHCAGCGEVAWECICAESVADTDQPDRPRTHCGCGYELVWVSGQWEHDAAPSMWGDDHDADEDPPTGPARDYWDRYDFVTEDAE